MIFINFRENKKDMKRIVIVGGFGGIGKAVIQKALDKNLEIVVLDLPQTISLAPTNEKIWVIETDASEAKSVQNAFEIIKNKWQNIDYLVNLAGFLNHFETIANYDDNKWDELLDGNLKSTYLSCKHAIPLMKSGGAIVNMSSGLGFIGSSKYGAYSASKAGTVSLTKTLAAELGPKIRVNAVAPGAVNTAFLSGGIAHGGEEGKSAQRVNMDAYLNMLPLKRIAEPDDIAGPIMFLLSDDAKYITGQTLHINGGGLMF
jgi:3-oxoacyl-[acyl-carrier protein] reductase